MIPCCVVVGFNVAVVVGVVVFTGMVVVGFGVDGAFVTGMVVVGFGVGGAVFTGMVVVGTALVVVVAVVVVAVVVT